jgi:hypothetical protein
MSTGVVGLQPEDGTQKEKSRVRKYTERLKVSGQIERSQGEQIRLIKK